MGDWELGRVYAAVVQSLAARMAEVLVAVDEARRLPSRSWSPAEVEQARAQWIALVARARDEKRIGPFPRGPLLDAVAGSYDTVVAGLFPKTPLRHTITCVMSS